MYGVIAHIVYIVALIALGAFSHRWLAQEAAALPGEVQAEVAKAVSQVKAAKKKP
jgi:hypothetical protein